MKATPHLETIGASTRLIVDGTPYLAVGGELHNSSSSDPYHMHQVWERIRGSGINTVIGSVGWDQVEPVEGQYDFAIVDWLIAGAREAGMRLVLIWFGAYKNAYSTYAPSWVRADRERFPRAVLPEPQLAVPFSYEGSMPRPTLSVFSPDLVEADRLAYCEFVRYLADHDPESTVLLIQVENEVGLLGGGRDRSALALAAWNAPVPPALRSAVGEEGTLFPETVRQALFPAVDSEASWAELFGEADDVADEAFMSWGFASYLEALSAAGKEIHPLPTYANAWIGPQQPGDRPGTYPSGGPTAGMLGVWKAAAPSLDFLAPDIYVPDSRPVMEQYAQPGNPLFIPEAKFRAGDAFLTIGQFGGLGYCVFGLEDGRPGNQFSAAAAAILAFTEEIAGAHERGTAFGFALEPDEDSASAVLDGVTVTVRNGPKLFGTMLRDAGVELPPPPELPGETEAGSFAGGPGDSRPFGMILRLPDGSFLLAGQGALIDFSADGADLEVDAVRELLLEDGTWREGRILNGDERIAILPADRIGAARITLLSFDRQQ